MDGCSDRPENDWRDARVCACIDKPIDEWAIMTTHCPEVRSFSLTTAQLVSDSSSVGHLAACMVCKEKEEERKRREREKTHFNQSCCTTSIKISSSTLYYLFEWHFYLYISDLYLKFGWELYSEWKEMHSVCCFSSFVTSHTNQHHSSFYALTKHCYVQLEEINGTL